MRRRLTERYTLALVYAAEVHTDQTRKGEAEIPYISHLLAASSLVIEAGGDEDEAIAALLHDAGEDQGGETRLADIDKRFGARVAAIVRECSDSLTDDSDAKADWLVRKQRYIAHLQTATPSALLVTAGDKTHNSGALVSDIQLHGVDYLNNFTATPMQTLWYFSQVLQTLIDREVNPRLVAILSENVAHLRELIEQ